MAIESLDYTATAIRDRPEYPPGMRQTRLAEIAEARRVLARMRDRLTAPKVRVS
jgi:hypothetical protein